MCQNQFAVQIYFGGVGYCVEAQYLVLPTLFIEKRRKLYGTFVIRPAVMIPVSGIVLLVIIGSRNGDQLHFLRGVPDLSRFGFIPEFKSPDAAEIGQRARMIHFWI